MVASKDSMSKEANRAKVTALVPEDHWKTVGRFAYDPLKLHQRQIRQLHKIASFFTDDVVERLLKPVANASFDVSLRLLDYCCTTADCITIGNLCIE